MEGLSHEAIDLAGHLKLSKLIVLFDDNGISIDGPTALATSTDQCAGLKLLAGPFTVLMGIHLRRSQMHLLAAQTSDKPTMIACRTVIGFGAPKKQGTAGVHGAPLGTEEIAAARDGT